MEQYYLYPSVHGYSDFIWTCRLLLISVHGDLDNIFRVLRVSVYSMFRGGYHNSGYFSYRNGLVFVIEVCC
ncbi:hypothetical protein L596_017142 [Steinernema carpocapsae]|uniref:Uncharacterized protein n=1 Tax=Steinernema carpocapsae TaxID=34508 RepID=A0A4U5N0Y6_STECR|nr:hypothetical protein L596_017142 [Steinernema carpocapsae]